MLAVPVDAVAGAASKGHYIAEGTPALPHLSRHFTRQPVHIHRLQGLLYHQM